MYVGQYKANSVQKGPVNEQLLMVAAAAVFFFFFTHAFTHKGSFPEQQRWSQKELITPPRPVL